VTHQSDVIVLGGGAAGLMCAIEAGKRGRRVIVLERADRLGKKILISGGGRCNFTNLHCSAANFLSANPHFAKSLLARYTPEDFIALVEKHGIAYHEKKLGQLFCDGSSAQIVALLEKECHAAGVQIVLNASIVEVRRTEGFVVQCMKDAYQARALVVATGGLSIPKMGATSFGYDLARRFGIAVRETRPALVPFLWSEDDRHHFADLAGVSADVVASHGAQSFRENLLFTHRGLSGPAILQISSYWSDASRISIDLAPGQSAVSSFDDTKTARTTATLRAALRSVLPNRLADRWMELHEPTAWSNPALEEFDRQLHEWNFTPAGTEGYDKAEVTAGGVDTSELSAKTMETQKVPGLFFIGEVVDVTGHLGGFNFQWAWASGAAAGRAV
jgi:predicted Rossmann fold flavoprotein